MIRASAQTIAVLVVATANAQWINHAAPGIPRTSDGKPNLTAPAPRAAGGKPDLSGIWQKESAYASDVTIDLKPGDILPWAQALYQERVENYAKENMAVLCLPDGPRYNTRSGLVKIVQTPLLAVVLHEDLTYRQIFLDGRALPKDLNPSFMGYSVARWEGDALVVESTGYNPRTWLDSTGHPHTEALRLIERYRRPDYGHLEISVTIEDPEAYRKPWTLVLNAVLKPDTDLLEFVCNESEKGKMHLVGALSEDRKRSVKVDTSLLAKYVGAFLLTLDGQPTRVQFLLEGDQFFVDRGGRGKQPMIALSDSLFSSVAGTYEFVVNGQDNASHVIYKQVESDVKGARIKP